MDKLSGVFKGGTGALAKGYANVPCSDTVHSYPKMYAGDPQYAAEYFSKCLCGKKKKVTVITEVDR